MSRVLALLRQHGVRVLAGMLGVFLLFFPPPALAGLLLVRFGGAMALLSAILGPHRMSIATTAVILGAVYVLGLGPMRFFEWLGRGDALGERGSPASFWRKREPARAISADPAADKRRRMRFQF